MYPQQVWQKPRVVRTAKIFFKDLSANLIATRYGAKRLSMEFKVFVVTPHCVVCSVYVACVYLSELDELVLVQGGQLGLEPGEKELPLIQLLGGQHVDLRLSHTLPRPAVHNTHI